MCDPVRCSGILRCVARGQGREEGEGEMLEEGQRGVIGPPVRVAQAKDGCAHRVAPIPSQRWRALGVMTTGRGTYQ